MSAQRPTSGGGQSEVAIVGIRFEQRADALGIGTARPRLSWRVETTLPGWRQAAYEIETYEPGGDLRERTGRVESDESVLVTWPFAPLASRERVAVRVRAWGEDGTTSAWGEAAVVEAGLLQPADWLARFVTPDWDEDTARSQPCPLLRREFGVRPGMIRARLYATALGVYEAHLNGQPIGDHVLDPGWTSYRHRLRYQTFDVTDLLREGANALGALLGDGWYRGKLGFGGGRRNRYGDRLALLAQLAIDYADGTTELVFTDDTWRAARGPLVMADLYDGEEYDARLERPAWAAAGHDDRDWAGVRPLAWDLSKLVAPAGPPVHRTEEVAPVAIVTSPSGKTLVDFGQNLVGRLRLTVRGEAGQTVTLRHAEVLEGGELGTRPLRHARATDRYTLRGGGAETWEPRFTFHGFRYAEVAGWPGKLRADDLRAVVCHSDLERTGWFDCSDPLLNRLHENVVWSMRGNFLDIPTDCPQRDERLGWTGDIQVFAPTACFLYDVGGFLQSWLADLAAEQHAAGSVPMIIPDVVAGVQTPMAIWATAPVAAWGDAAVIVPWVLYQRLGDTGILATQYDSMRAWVDLLDEIAGEGHLWDSGFQLGDWLDPSAPPDDPGAARTDPYLVATAYFARSAELLGRAAGVLGRDIDAARYAALALAVRDAFAREYVSPGGRLVSDAQTAYALALEFALLPDEGQRRRAGARLAELVRKADYRIATGFVGTPLICDALCGAGAEDAAFRLLTQRACPSWLYQVAMGATTTWERWDSMLPDGTINPGQMTSFNHYALGAVADWLHRVVGGLAPAAPGYRRLTISPRPGGDLTRARARHRTPYGMAEVAWEVTDGRMAVEVLVPPDTTAIVTLPGSDAAPIEVGAGSHRWAYPHADPSGRRPVPTLESTLDEVVADPAAWALVAHQAPILASRALTRPGFGSLPLRLLLTIFPEAGEALGTIDAALGNLGRERAQRADAQAGGAV